MSNIPRSTRRSQKNSSSVTEPSEHKPKNDTPEKRRSTRLSGKQLPQDNVKCPSTKQKVFNEEASSSDENESLPSTISSNEKRKLLMSPGSALAEEVGTLEISSTRRNKRSAANKKKGTNLNEKLNSSVTPEKAAKSQSDSEGTPEKKFRGARNQKKEIIPITTNITKALKGRETEFESIKSWILGSKENKTSLSVYISGQPGTGKTATTLKVLESLGSSVRSCMINCASTCSKLILFKTIFESLGLDAKPKIDIFEEHVKSLKIPLVLVLDEIDHLASRKNTALYAAFQWPETLSYKIIVIGIANSIDLTERLLPKLMLTKPPKRLVFEPYTKDDIVEILNDKMRQEESTVDSKAIELTARKVAAMSGDLRTALHIFKQQKSRTTSLDSEGALPGTPVSGCREVLGIINNVYSSPLARARLPLQPRILLAVSLSLSSNKKCTFDRSSLTSAYYKACEALRMPALDDDDLHSAFQTLESQSFIRQINAGKLVLQVDAPTAKSAISDNAMLDQIGLLQL
uniref:Cell division control protein n=1 Tax=Caenorhabditis tropicalis TaxID=1561998 RepID=A0A1I7TJY9_9PELO